MATVYDLLVDLPEGIGIAPVFAEDRKQAMEIGRKLFPGHRLAGFKREEEDVSGGTV